jgi:GDP-L-fucose synthase
MHFIFDLIRKILRAGDGGGPPVLWGDGYQKRELVYVDDFVTLALDLAADIENDIVNIGAGREHSIRYFAQLICSEVGYDFDRIVFDESRYVGAASKCLDTARLSALRPDLKLTDLREGIARVIAWFRSNPEAMRA